MKFLSASAIIGRPALEIFRPWRSLFLAIMLLVAATFGALYVEVAQAQGVDGAITGLTLTSDVPGTLTVSWETASPTPTDYRIDWAKSTEEYKSWTVDDGHVYPAETATAATIADLSHDTQYKVRLRARYYTGEHHNNSWGGPWATATIIVAGEPAETPTPEPSPDPTPDPTPEPGTITGLTLTSDAPGALTVSWETASPTPTNYRIDWATSDEGYTSWKVDDGHVYPAATATAATITDLDHDAEYKVRLRARYYTGEHEGNSWGGPWATATITVAGEPAETPTPEPGTIDTLAATDDDTGQLVLTWGPPAAPNADPTDYHINWAKSTESYPADTAEAGNAHPDSTTHTLASLEYDTDYNIRVRARYTDGENADSPWNGPWTETTAQVKLPLPMALNLMGAAVSPENKVFLFWSDPSDDSITGYQILRGPDAENLAVIEDDTGSSSTSYTDTAPPAGETHTYAVKARNPSGLSPLSDTVTATVPAAKKEEVLIVVRHESNDDVLVSNLGQTTGSRDVIVGSDGSNQYARATSFTTGNNALGYHPTGAQLDLRRFEAVSPTPQVSIREDSSGLPSDTVLSSLTTSTALTGESNIITFTVADEVTLQPNTKYWLHVTATGTRAIAQETAIDNEDTQSQGDWSIGNTGVSRTDVEPWATATGSRVLLMKILGHGISPDPNDETPPGVMESVSEPADGDVADDTTTIGRLVPNDRVTGRLHAGIVNVDPTIYDVDWFAFEAEANTDYQFTANPGKKGLPYYILRIFNDEGTELRNSKIKGRVEVSPLGNITTIYHTPDRINVLPFRTHAAGTYYVSIESQHGNYSAVAWTLAMLGDDYSEDVDTTATVMVDESGRNFDDFQNYLMRTDANPESSRTSDVDWIRVALEAGATYEIVYDVACLHEGQIVGVYDSTGILIPGTGAVFESNKKIRWCGDITTRFTPKSDGDHYIAVTARGANHPGGGNQLNGHWNPFQGVQGTLSIKVTSPPSTAATGDPLIHGERKVGATLTGDTKGIADVDGLTNVRFDYQWQRMEDGMSEDIPAEVSETYTLTDDDVGKRIQFQVQFTDDRGDAEVRTGPGTSVITNGQRQLVGNIAFTNDAYSNGRRSQGFVTGSNEHGYVIQGGKFLISDGEKARPLGVDDAEMRIYNSTTHTTAAEHRPNNLIMSSEGRTRYDGVIVEFYDVPSRARLEPDATYHAIVFPLTAAAGAQQDNADDNGYGCRQTDSGADGSSLAGFSIMDRNYRFAPAGGAGVYAENKCRMAINGVELVSPTFIEKMEFTSTPANDGVYAVGELIEVTVTLNEGVISEATPVLYVQVGGNERKMTYVASASNISEWVFRYKVKTWDNDTDGIGVKKNKLQGHADADLSHPGIRQNLKHGLANALSRVVGRWISSKPVAPGHYTVGEQIQVTVRFILPVTVIGDPDFAIEIHPNVRGGTTLMPYLSGSGTRELVFSYTVGGGDYTGGYGGINLHTNPIRLDGDDQINAVYDGRAALLDYSGAGSQSGHEVTRNPRAVSQEVTSDPMRGTDSDTYGAGDAITFAVVFNQPVTVNGAPRLRFSITGPGDEYATYVSGSGTNTLVFSYTVLATEMDSDGIYLYHDPLDYPDENVDSIVSTSRPGDNAVNDGIGKEGVLSGHKVDGTITN